MAQTRLPTITLMGLGYVGLTTAAALSSRGFRVRGYDVNRKKVERINSGDPTFYEPGLSELLEKALKNGFRANDELEPSDIYFISVGTPSLEDGSIDLSHIRSASGSLGELLRENSGYSVVVIRSTVVPGTAEGLVRPLIESISKKRVGGTEIGLASNPEFLREGSAVEDTFNPDRLVIGELDRRSGDYILRMYRRFYGSTRMPPLIRTTTVNAELIKYANNAFLATKVSFINMIANFCRLLPGADVKTVAEGIGLDRRIGREFLRAGAGWGGSCFLKDLKALNSAAREAGARLPLVDATIEVNEAQPREVVTLARTLIGNLRGKKIAVLGLSFKPDTDDVREAVSIKVINILLGERAWVRAYDPAAIEKAKHAFRNLPLEKKNRLSFGSSAIDALKGAECCIVVTEWEEFKSLRPSDFVRNMRTPAVVDGRRIYDPREFKNLKFAAVGLGPRRE